MTRAEEQAALTAIVQLVQDIDRGRYDYSWLVARQLLNWPAWAELSDGEQQIMLRLARQHVNSSPSGEARAALAAMLWGVRMAELRAALHLARACLDDAATLGAKQQLADSADVQAWCDQVAELGALLDGQP